MSDPAKGITCPDSRRVVREALAGGWQWAGWSGTTHGKIVWPATGESVGFGSTPSVASWKTLATEIERISGVIAWRKGNRKRSRKAMRPSGFSVEVASTEQRRWAGSTTGGHIQDLHDEREDLTSQIRDLAALGTRSAVEKARPLAARLASVNAELERLHQPVPEADWS